MRKVFVLMLFGVIGLWAATPLAIQEHGRVQPLDSYGRRVVAVWGGKTPADFANAAELLQAIAVDSDSARQWPLFRIDRTDVAQALGLAGGKKRYYSFKELTSQRYLLERYAQRALSAELAQRQSFDLEMLRLWNGVQVFEQWNSLLTYKSSVAPLLLFPDSTGTWKSLQTMPAFWSGFARPAFFPSLQAWQQVLDSATQHRVFAEYWYYQLEPFAWARHLLVLALLSFGIALWRPGRGWWKRCVTPLIMLATGLGFLGLMVRAYVGQRPPVANLYETLLFVAFCVLLVGVALQKWGRLKAGGVVGAMVAWLLLGLATLFASQADTLGVLAAVLNSHFWLTAHVLTIALGYVGILVAGVVGHAWLCCAGLRRVITLAKLSTMLRITLALALFFTFTGTVLGGIWADQSWGRFWGWDPKENGALLLILWIAILLHARRAGWLTMRGMALGAVWGLIVLALAWFGLNMLGIGLHAYGMAGQGRWLLGYMAVQALIALSLAWWSS